MQAAGSAWLNVIPASKMSVVQHSFLVMRPPSEALSLPLIATKQAGRCGMWDKDDDIERMIRALRVRGRHMAAWHLEFLSIQTGT
jgi:hypothetical protein